jgi:hypothetical protein
MQVIGTRIRGQLLVEQPAQHIFKDQNGNFNRYHNQR